MNVNSFHKFDLTYVINKGENKIKLFGDEFVRKNKERSIIIIQNKLYPCQEYFALTNYSSKKKIINALKITLLIFNEGNSSIDLSKMFYECKSLSVFTYSNKECYKIINQDYFFSNCLEIIKEKPKKNNFKLCPTKIKDINNIFYGCESMISLPDISNWITDNINNFYNICHECNSLLSLPDISKWNTSNITNMSGMFRECCSLISLPDISKWDTSNVIDMSYIFSGCSSLISLPDISKWNTSKLIDMSYIFSGCSSLISLPDISKWNTNNIRNMNNIFNLYLIYLYGILIMLVI